MQRGEGGCGGARGGEGRGELCLQLGETLLRGMSAHHVVAVDAVGRVLHAVVHLPPEHRQVLSEPAETGAGSVHHRVQTRPPFILKV